MNVVEWIDFKSVWVENSNQHPLFGISIFSKGVVFCRVEGLAHTDADAIDQTNRHVCSELVAVC